jgi:hypothetical protein
MRLLRGPGVPEMEKSKIDPCLQDSEYCPHAQGDGERSVLIIAELSGAVGVGLEMMGGVGFQRYQLFSPSGGWNSRGSMCDEASR